ncbi:hypothetical protein F480_08900 [Bibersteinia trehalosi Y31]|uniref:Uncharacterized protein n=1 Tax=Bibersteinia trehalosi Y31 TaxID=1261658 RepID=A0A179CYG4_BIBTR|nr:hypothetical protein F480_08900 [Bibersteinia trehalosi Y31]
MYCLTKLIANKFFQPSRAILRGLAVFLLRSHF